VNVLIFYYIIYGSISVLLISTFYLEVEMLVLIKDTLFGDVL
jgi:hypothetical protein